MLIKGTRGCVLNYSIEGQFQNIPNQKNKDYRLLHSYIEAVKLVENIVYWSNGGPLNHEIIEYVPCKQRPVIAILCFTLHLLRNSHKQTQRTEAIPTCKAIIFNNTKLIYYEG